ncbi:MAG TPA: sigma-70 family RNA polymerase sigma factor [Puia sp.]|nr:sigma-70 family RNA polymerase sigma factor [Puia sp.]
MSNLFQQFASGSEEAFVVYYQRYHKSIYASIKRLCGDDALAEDLTQEVFKNLWDRRAELNDEDHLRNNLFLMARSYFLDNRRRRKIHARAEEELRRTAEPGDDIELTLVTEEVFAIVEGTMMKLPPQQKMVLELLLLRGLDVRAVAKRMQLAPQTVRNHKSQAIHFLRTELYRLDLSLAVLLIILLLCFYEI